MQELNQIGSKLQALRKEKGDSQQDVANYLNTKRQTIGAYETASSMPTIDNLRRLSIYFGVSSDYLIGLSDTPNATEIYTASNIQGSNFVQGSGSVTIGELNSTSKEESELLRIYRNLDVRSRTKLMNAAFDLEDSKE